MKVVLATKNPGKLKELQQLALEAPWLTLVLAPDNFDPEESGKTFVENATIKAQAASRLTGLPAIADDSGLIVEALNGRPGIHSARYCEGTDADRRAKLLQELANIPADKRDASFMCAMVFCNAQGEKLHTVIRFWSGRIGLKEAGQNGFGFDPLFYLLDSHKTAAELAPEEKNRLSHRGQAWRQMLAYLHSLELSCP